MCNEIPGLEVLQDLQQQLVEQQDENIKQQQKINNQETDLDEKDCEIKEMMTRIEKLQDSNDKFIKLVENLREGVNSKQVIIDRLSRSLDSRDFANRNLERLLKGYEK